MIYVLVTGFYDDYREIGVYSSKMTAKAEIERIEGKKVDLRSYQSIRIHPYTLDAPTKDEIINDQMNYVPPSPKVYPTHPCPVCGCIVEYDDTGDYFTWCDFCNWQGFTSDLTA